MEATSEMETNVAISEMKREICDLHEKVEKLEIVLSYVIRGC